DALVAHFVATPQDRPVEGQALLLMLFQAWWDALHAGRRLAALSPRHRDMVDEVQRRLLQNLLQPPEVETLAAGYQLGPEHFSRLFKAGTGRSLRDFVEEQRLLQSRRLLLEGRHNVAEAARAVGFTDPY